jgi:outer membrane immunogenic protein
MKRILIAGAFALAAGGQALAADLPQPAPPPRAPATYVPAVVPYYNWTGFYIGGNLGGDWNQGSLTDNGPAFKGINLSGTHTGFLGGGQVGFNYQFGGGVVIGAEADFDWAPNSNNTTTGVIYPAASGLGSVSGTVNNQWLTTFAGRFGYAWDRLLVYGKGGGAWVGSSNSTIASSTLGSFNLSSSSSNYGWVAGAGIEYAFWNNVSVRLEYDYIGLNSAS